MLKPHREPAKPQPATAPVILALGFRPLFILAGLSAVLLMAAWLAIWASALPLPNYYGVIGWHSHEMLFGYTTAVIGGFLLTAVRNWTGINTPNGILLACLAAIWLAGRLAPLASPILPPIVIALSDLAFLPATALAIAPALWRGEQKVNRIFIPILLLMGLANLYVHLQALGISQTAAQGINTMLYLVVGLITLLGGRVIPFFTEAVGQGYRAKRFPRVEQANMGLFTLLLLVELSAPSPWLSGALCLSIALVQGIRLFGWYHKGIWQSPILWVLYSGIAWIILGFILIALALFGLISHHPATHALTTGGIGIITLGMMSRVALGHTGRSIQPRRVIEWCFIGLNLATLFRVLGPLALPAHHTIWINLSGALWVVIFLIFSAVYMPMLIKPRIDGKAG